MELPDESSHVTLVMKGGGIKGLAYVGALEVLFEHYSFDRFVGTSAGAITALLLAAGYDVLELKTILHEKNFREFLDAPLWSRPFNLLFHGGMNHAHSFTDWLDVLLAEKLKSEGRVKLSDLPARATVFASRKEKAALQFDSRTNDAEAAHAARCSMSIPFVFVPQLDQGFRTFDGGLQHNYPIRQILEEDPEVKLLGIYIGSEIYKPKRSHWQLFELVSIWTESHDLELLKKYRNQTVIIDTEPIGTLDFDLSSVEKHFLILCGRVGALSHLEKGSERHIAAVVERDSLRVQVDSIRRKRKIWRRLKLMVILFLLILIIGLCNNSNSYSQAEKPLPDPPESIPSLTGSGLELLTDVNRQSSNYVSSKIAIVNETNESIRLSFDYLPRFTEEQDSTFVHRVSRNIPPKSRIIEYENNFGGPYHISVLSKGRWHPENSWFNLMVVPSRTVVVSYSVDGFECTVFEGIRN